MRKGEAPELRHEDIDMAVRPIHIVPRVNDNRACAKGA